MTLVRRVMNWLSPEPTARIEAEEENMTRDRAKLDEKFLEALKAAKHMRNAADTFILVGELFVGDVTGGASDEKTPTRSKKHK